MLHKFFLKYEKRVGGGRGGGVKLTLPRKKLPSKSPALLGLKNTSGSYFCRYPHCKGFEKICGVKQNLWGNNLAMNIIYDRGKVTDVEFLYYRVPLRTCSYYRVKNKLILFSEQNLFKMMVTCYITSSCIECLRQSFY